MCAALHAKAVPLSAVHPGLIDTDLARSWMRNGCPRPLRRVLHPLLDIMFPFILLPPRHAAATLLWAASAPHRMVSLHDAGNDAWPSDCSHTAASSSDCASGRHSQALCTLLLPWQPAANLLWASSSPHYRVCLHVANMTKTGFALWAHCLIQACLPSQQTPEAADWKTQPVSSLNRLALLNHHGHAV